MKDVDELEALAEYKADLDERALHEARTKELVEFYNRVAGYYD